MKQYDISFILNVDERIIIKLLDPLSAVHCCYSADFVFEQGGNSYLLANDRILCVQGNLQSFVCFLQEALGNNLQLHPSLNKIVGTNRDIGYFFNQHRQEKLIDPAAYVVKPGEEFDSWVGYTYLLWGVNFAAWMYNDDKGNIIFELTPTFPGKPAYRFDSEPLASEAIANSAWYDEWIQSYKPILIRTIPREVAQQWLEQAEDILKIIEDNIARMTAEHAR